MFRNISAYACYTDRERCANNNTHLTALGLGLPGCIGKPIWIYWSKGHCMAVVSVGPYANLHLAPDRYHASTPLVSFLPAAQPTM